MLVAEMVPDKKDGAQADATATGSAKTAKAGLIVMQPGAFEEFAKKCAWKFLKWIYFCTYLRLQLQFIPH